MPARHEGSLTLGAPLHVSSPGAMRGIELALLVFLLSWERGLSLQCYSCLGLVSNNQCQPQPSPCAMSGVCFSSNIAVTLANGMKVKTQHKGCAPSCEEVSKILNQLSPKTSPGSQIPDGLMKFEVEGLSCCEKDLCNGVARAGRSLWALAGGLLLSLGPALLWALL
ncbi:lymphocyte antigen 6H-like [Hyaena hyaena]|uniref:lymphocyte antigen 6H-like n=1 Tax=Hyaena hyaena TaxID=95912 RepID=UPI0019222349|nr:lymphocyte antigen 6H-like [Hyaena hyaena]XP_039109947.1 lymphocyte antigen 6H-like [Hyaena hyaena]